MNDAPSIEINFRGPDGERSLCRVLPIDLRFVVAPGSDKPRWCMKALDVAADRLRLFPLEDIQRWAFPKAALATPGGGEA